MKPMSKNVAGFWSLLCLCLLTYATWKDYGAVGVGWLTLTTGWLSCTIRFHLASLAEDIIG